MKSAKTMTTLTIGVLLGIAILPYSLVLAPGLDYYAYKELTYDVVANNVTKGVSSDTEAVKLLAEYIFEEMHIPPGYRSDEPGYKLVDKDSYNDLFRGINECDQRAWMLGHLAGRLGIDNRMLMLKGHAASEVYLDGKWRFIDPLTVGYVPGKNGLAGYREISDDNRLFTELPVFDGIKKRNQSLHEGLEKYWTGKVFVKDYPIKSIWGNPYLKKGFSRKVITGMMEIYYSVFGDFFSHSFQELYLKTRKDIEITGDYVLTLSEEADKNFFMARNYELFSRWEDAVVFYEKALKGGSENVLMQEDIRFFYSRLLRKIDDPVKAERFLSEIIEKHPESRWVPYSLIAIGDLSTEKGDLKRGDNFYKKAYDVFMKDFKPKNRILWDFRIIVAANKLQKNESI